jgi:hypothetical protein
MVEPSFATQPPSRESSIYEIEVMVIFKLQWLQPIRQSIERGLRRSQRTTFVKMSYLLRRELRKQNIKEMNMTTIAPEIFHKGLLIEGFP